MRYFSLFAAVYSGGPAIRGFKDAQESVLKIYSRELGSILYKIEKFCHILYKNEKFFDILYRTEVFLIIWKF